MSKNGGGGGGGGGMELTTIELLHHIVLTFTARSRLKIFSPELHVWSFLMSKCKLRASFDVKM